MKPSCLFLRARNLHFSPRCQGKNKLASKRLGFLVQWRRRLFQPASHLGIAPISWPRNAMTTQKRSRWMEQSARERTANSKSSVLVIRLRMSVLVSVALRWEVIARASRSLQGCDERDDLPSSVCRGVGLHLQEHGRLHRVPPDKRASTEPSQSPSACRSPAG